MERNQKHKAYKKVHHKPTHNVSKQKEKTKMKNKIGKKTHEMTNEKYEKDMKDYFKMLESCEKGKEYIDRPNISLLLYASQYDKREDLEALSLRQKLKGKLKRLLKHALLHDNEDLGIWFLQKFNTCTKLKEYGTALMNVAVNKGYANVLKELLEQHFVDVNSRDDKGETALHLALKKDNEQPTICRILLEHGAKTNIPDRNGILPLHRVSRDSNNTKMIDLLLEFNADIEALDKHGRRPLEYAFDRKINRQTAVCLLIKQGATIRTKLELKPILREIRNRSPKANVHDMSVLDVVDLTGDIGALVDLLKEDGDISTLCKSNRHATVKRLLRYVELTGSHRLHRCLQERSLSLVDKSPSDAQRQCNISKTTIAKSLSNEDLLLNEVGAKQEQGQSKQHISILHFEATDGSEFVLSRGDDGLTDKSLMDPNTIDVVVVVSPSHDKESIQKVFRLAAQHFIHAAHGIPEKGPLKLIHIPTRSFLADPSLPNRIPSDQQLKLCWKSSPYDCLPLHNEILHKRSDLLQNILNRRKEDVNAEDEAGWTALHLAILLGETEMVKMLIDYGADASSRLAHYLPAFVFTEWEMKLRVTLSPLSLSVCLNLKDIVEILTESNPGNPSINMCIELSYGLGTESALLESVCREAERRYEDIGARFKPTYKVHKNQPIERVCLGFSKYVDEIEKKEDIHGVSVVIINTDISPESNWIEESEMTEDEEVICKSVIDSWADDLWDQHPNLNAITAGSIASVKCPEAKSTAHIILHCSHKGYVPNESRRFPTELTCEKGTIPVAVLDGVFSLSPLPLVSDSNVKSSDCSANKEYSNSPPGVSVVTPSDKDENSYPVPGVSGVISTDHHGTSNTTQVVSGAISTKENQEKQDATTCVCVANTSFKKAQNRCPMKTVEHCSLKVGMHLRTSQQSANTEFIGTVGSFVEMGNDKTGFLTCSHLFYNQAISDGRQPIHFSCSGKGCGADVIAPFDHYFEKVKRGVTDMEIDDYPGCAADDDNDDNGRSMYWECGKVVRAIFDPSLETGVDAAIVEIDPERVPCDGSFDDINHIHLRNAKMNSKHRPTFRSGKQADQAYLNAVSQSDRPIRCMKLGASSGLSVGILTWKHGQIRLPNSVPLGIERDSCHKYIMKGQYVISEYNRKQFFECGDSGSAVFVMKRDNTHYYPDACLGIAIGFLDKKTFVTPIGSILDTLRADNLPELALKKFK